MRSIYSRFVRDYLVQDDRYRTEGSYKLTKGIRAIQKEMPDSKEEINTMIDTLKAYGLLGEVKKGATAIPFTAAVEVIPTFGSTSSMYGIKFTTEPIKVLMDLNTNRTVLKALDRGEVEVKVTYLSGIRPLMDAMYSLGKPNKLNMDPQGQPDIELHPSIQKTLEHAALGFNGNVALTDYDLWEGKNTLSGLYGSLEELAREAQVTLSEIYILTQESEWGPEVLHRGPYDGCRIEYVPDYGDPYGDTGENTIHQTRYCSDWDDYYDEDDLSN